jgi:hypothetical protein
MGNRNGEEGYEADVDEGGRADAEGARTREDEDECDRTEAQAQRRGNVSESTGTWPDGGGGSKEEKDIATADLQDPSRVRREGSRPGVPAGVRSAELFLPVAAPPTAAAIPAPRRKKMSSIFAAAFKSRQRWW